MEGVDAETIFVRLIRARMCSLGVGSFRTSGVRAASFRCTCIEWRFSGETSGPANVGRFDGRSNTEVLDRWHEEQDPVQRASSVAVVPPPQPLADPRRGLTFTPSHIFGAVLAFLPVITVASPSAETRMTVAGCSLT